MINITFSILCVIRGLTQIRFAYYDKSRILVHTALHLRNTKSLCLNAHAKRFVSLIWKFILSCSIFQRAGRTWRGWCYNGYRCKWKPAICKWKSNQSVRCIEKIRSSSKTKKRSNPFMHWLWDKRFKRNISGL